MFDQPPLDRIAMHVMQFLFSLHIAPNIEVVKSSLQNRRPFSLHLQISSPLAVRVPPFLTAHFARHPLFKGPSSPMVLGAAAYSLFMSAFASCSIK
jgi:hypothetical protein